MATDPKTGEEVPPQRQTAMEGTTWATSVTGLPSLDPVQYPQRTAVGIRPQGTYGTQLQNDLATGKIKVFYPSAGTQSKGVTYRGPGLLDEQGYLARPWYTLDTDSVNTELMNLNSEERLIIAEQLKRTNYYGSSEISESLKRKSGFTETDMAAFLRLMRDANIQGKTLRAMLPDLMQYPSVAGTGAGVKVTPREDVAYYMKQASLTHLGRMPTKAEIDQAVKSIQNAERAAASGGTTAPATSVLATAQAQQAAPAERSSYALGQAINLAFRALTGG